MSYRFRGVRYQNVKGCFCQFSTKPNAEDEPIKFSTSEAALKISRHINRKNQSNAPWFEPPVIMASIAVFLIYFCILREENDFDEEMKVSLFDRLPGKILVSIPQSSHIKLLFAGLERKQLEAAIEYNLQQGKDASDLQARLEVIERTRNKKN